MDEYLSDSEKEMVESFYANAPLREAIKKVILFDVYGNGVLKKDKAAVPTRNAALSLFMRHQNEVVTDEALGAQLRAMGEAVIMVEGSFDRMAKVRKPIVNKKPSNPAR